MKLTKQQAVIISAYTGVLACDFSSLQNGIEEKLGRPVYTHELASEQVREEIRNAFREDFINLTYE